MPLRRKLIQTPAASAGVVGSVYGLDVSVFGAVVPVRAVRRDGSESAGRTGVSGGVDLAAVGGYYAGADDAPTAIRQGHTGVAFA